MASHVQRPVGGGPEVDLGPEEPGENGFGCVPFYDRVNREKMNGEEG